MDAASGESDELAGSLSFHSGQVTDLAGETVTANGAESGFPEAEATDAAASAPSDADEGAGPGASSIPAPAVIALVAVACAQAAFLAFRRKGRGKPDEGGK